MPLGAFEREVLGILAANRNPDSYVAGATLLNRDPASPRTSRDVDVFHDTLESLTESVDRDRVYRRSDNYIAFVATADSTSGAVNLLDIMKWVLAKGWLSDKSSLHQICYGVEVVSTDDVEATFEVTSFSIEAKSKPALDIRTPSTSTTNSTPASSPGKSDAGKPQ